MGFLLDETSLEKGMFRFLINLFLRGWSIIFYLGIAIFGTCRQYILKNTFQTISLYFVTKAIFYDRFKNVHAFL